MIYLYMLPKVLSKKIVPFIKNEIEEYHSKGEKVIFICDSHKKNDSEFKMFPPHCVKGTKGAEIIDELPKTRNDGIIKKRRYSGFYGTNLDRILEDISPERVEVVGVCTSICVMDTVGGLSNREIPVTVYKKGVADFDKEMHEFSLKRIEKFVEEKVPFDAIGVGSALFKEKIDFTADIVKVSGKPCAKVGRQYNPNPRLELVR